MKFRSFRRYYAAVGCRSAITATTQIRPESLGILMRLRCVELRAITRLNSVSILAILAKFFR
jgi:hypothetical protein